METQQITTITIQRKIAQLMPCRSLGFSLVFD